ncbi:hypothetical protein Stsp02_48820 [Streptomyces sp. NBRC 14336]|uniref:hypothetical protein n=1 Tax=Streptomyces sp. NBRC 14336 TaxID=3030992 RepID=UPI0024A412F6|nr:hypothetical protein [Streptomyces sp. NBRC 14336]WBO79182.1 hypothetical protein SBE_002867 [Streptomyces sp. SBE_14.2]GLW49221.1 hypothetical protein Stsp02_48820 [Streptomyces sp. NBRC 14336]
MSRDDLPARVADPGWWRAPLLATLVALPLLAWQYAMFGAVTFEVFDGVVLWGLGLLAASWPLPRHRGTRTLRITAAVTGLVCTVVPLLFLVFLVVTLT